MSWSLTKKLYASFGSIIIAIVVLGLVVFSGMREADRLSIEQRRLQHGALDAERLNTLVIQCRRHEKDYFARAAEKDKQLHGERTRAVLELSSEMSRKLGSEDAALVKALGGAQAGFERYRLAFDAAATTFEARGTVENGLQGEFRTAARELQRIAEEQNDPALHVIVLQMRRAEKDYLLREAPQYVEDFKRLAGEVKAHVAKAQKRTQPADDDDAKSASGKAPSLPALSAERATQITQALTAYSTKFDAAVDAMKALAEYKKELHLATVDTEASIDELVDLALTRADSADVASDQIERRSENVFLTAIVAVLLLALVVARVLSNQLGASVAALSAGTRSITGGDLRTRVDVRSADELGALGGSFNQMVGSLRDMTSNMSTASASMEQVVSELTATVAEQAAALQQQAASVSETVTTTAQLARSSDQVSSVAQRVLDEAGRSVETSSKGMDAIRQSVHGMNDVRDQVGNIATTILDLSNKTQQIGTIIATVDDFAERSSLLALNASIEAARAGEAGKAFAVVAGEVKSLAEQSQRATERVRAILSDIQRTTHTAVLVTEEGSKRVERGVALTTSAGEIIGALSGAIESAADSAKQIAAASRQQTIGIEQISLAMSGIEQFSRQNVQATKQTELTAHSIAAVSKQLKATTAQYQV